jgi:hypothetical protein
VDWFFIPIFVETIKIRVMTLLDKNGVEIYVGADVEVPSPSTEDQWNFEFTGVVIKLDKTNGYAIVEDMDGDCWAVEFERLEIL